MMSVIDAVPIYCRIESLAAQPDRPSRRMRVGSSDNRIGIDAEMPVEIGDRAGLAEMLDAQRHHAVPGHRAEPGQRQRVAVADRNDRTMRRQPVQQTVDM